jgi:hypothetical protein
MRPIPNTVESLIRELETLYPPRCILVGERPEDAHRYAGAVELVADLRVRLNWTQENALPKEVLHVHRR